MVATEIPVVVFSVDHGLSLSLRVSREGGLTEYLLVLPSRSPRRLSRFITRVASVVTFAILPTIALLHRINVVHLQSYKLGRYALFLKRLGKPYMIIEHLSAFFRDEILDSIDKIRPVFAGASLRAAVSPPFSQRLRSITGLEFETVPNFIDDRFFVPVVTNRLGSANIITAIGSLDGNKNFSLLIEAAALVDQENLMVRIVGTGPDRESLIKRAQMLSPKVDISFLGPMGRDDIRRVISDSEFVAITSKSETFGIVAIEAMAMGKPVLSTRCGGPESTVIDGMGFIVDGEPHAYARGIEKMFSTDWDPKKIREYFEEYFSARSGINNMRRLYKRTIRRGTDGITKKNRNKIA